MGKMIRFLTDLPGGRPPLVLALGVFDAVHLGHREIIAAAEVLAEKRGAQVCAVTFFPHPREVLCHTPPLLLLTREARIALLQKSGCAAVGMIDFTPSFAQMSPENFCRALVEETAFRTEGVVVGSQWRFGAEAAGNVRKLQEIFAGFDVETLAVAEKTFDGTIISATRIRDAVLAGNLADAAAMLGRPVALYGKVVRGFGDAAKLLDAPTVNVEIHAGVLPPDGVYRGRVLFAGGGCYAAAVNIGVAPTFSGRGRRVEAHLFDFGGDVYGEKMQIELLDFLRPEKKFSSVAELKEQINRDLESCRERP